MAEIVVHDAFEIPHYDGPHSIPGIRFRPARSTLGVSAWGMNVLEIDAGCTGYLEHAHAHAHDDQAEVYVVLRGAAVLHADGAIYPVTAGAMVRVPPAVKRTFTTESGVVLLALGATPGVAYSPSPGM
ncbi:MAG: mannose-6-phosphate isomerase-like protein (cupin superfamily) [Myxococcota bacterium]|jgi:mannose-6-phosphate isomerase-like protein (cupin superfamily)